MLDALRLYFHSLYIDSVSERNTQALLQMQVDSGQCMTPLMCKINTKAKENIIRNSWVHNQPLGLTPTNTTIGASHTAIGGHTISHYRYVYYGQPWDRPQTLRAIFENHLSTAPPRISRMMLRAQKNMYDVEIKYAPGPQERVYHWLMHTIKRQAVSVHELHLHLNPSPMGINKIKEETAKDEVILSLWTVIAQVGQCKIRMPSASAFILEFQIVLQTPFIYM